MSDCTIAPGGGCPVFVPNHKKQKRKELSINPLRLWSYLGLNQGLPDYERRNHEPYRAGLLNVIYFNFLCARPSARDVRIVIFFVSVVDF